ncbi:MAG: hypothetical protein ABJE10_18450 [bacterium]
MYVGHAAIALALKSRAPSVPIVPLALACYGPDWLEVGSMALNHHGQIAEYTHSIPAVIIGAAVASALYALIARRPGAAQILAGWLLHWPADYITGRKPVITGDTLIGLDLYRVPLADIAIETALVVIACVLYSRAVAKTSAHRRIVAMLGAALTASQFAMVYVGRQGSLMPWSPSLADEATQSHLVQGVGFTSFANAEVSDPHVSCTTGSYLNSERVMATKGTNGVATLICLTCGKEKYFSHDVPAAASCDQCGGTVFRTFSTPTEPDDAVIDALESQARSISYGDSSPDSTQGDARDLDLL